MTMKVAIDFKKLPTLNNTQVKILNELKNDDFNLMYSELSRRLNIPVSTVHDAWRVIREQFDLQIEITIKQKEN